MAATISDLRINGLDPSSVTVFSGLYPSFSWDFVEDVESTTQAGFNLRIGSSNAGLGSNSFVGDKVNMNVDSSVPYFEYPYNNLSRGIVYFGQVKVWDAEKGTGSAHESSWSTFHFSVNALPTVTNVWLNPTAPTVSDNLYVVYDYDDTDGHTESTSAIRWYKHNILQEEFNDLTEIESKDIGIGDSWSVRVTPFDGLEYGPTAQSTAVTVSASGVSITGVEILPKDANIDDYLKVDYDLSDDPYVDIQTADISYEWYVNGVKTAYTTQVVRMALIAGDSVYAKVIAKGYGNTIAEGQSSAIIIADSIWHLSNIRIGGRTDPIGLTELRPIIEWEKHKSQTDSNDLPLYLRILITKTPSTESPIYDTGYIEYTKDNHVFTSDAFGRGKRYFVHIGAGDTATFDNYVVTEVITAGSSWSDNVSNSSGWTIEFKAKLESDAVGSRQCVYIHDGTYFCSLIFAIENVSDAGTQKKASKILFTSTDTSSYDIVEATAEESFDNFQTYRITGFGREVKIFLNNKIVLTGTLSDFSNLKQIQFGDINPNQSTPGVWKFFRYSTDGAYNIGENTVGNDDEFEFYTLASIPGGSIEDMMDGAVPTPPSTANAEIKSYFPSSFLVSWTPTIGSGKLLSFNENGEEATFPVATKNYSPITSIKFDRDQNKYVSTSNGVVAIYGSKHDADYEFSTTGAFTITSSDFDQITNLPAAVISSVLTTNGSIAIDTTFNTLGIEANPEWVEQSSFDPYLAKISHGVFYFSQRTHGHSWFDNVDNDKGWQAEFSLNVGQIEQDEADETDLDKQGVGVYINDGTYQEIVIFTKAKVTLFYANVSADLNTGFRRVYRIVGKGKNLKIYQRYSIMAAGTEQLLIDGSGLFTTSASKTGNSRKPRIAIDSDGNYHSVWHDDGSRATTILYSKYSGNSWSVPEVVIESAPFTLKNPDITLDSNGNIFVVYEDLSYGQVEISASIKDTVGWNPKIRLTNYPSQKTTPRLTVDGNDNIHVVWEDYRNGKSEIFWCYRSKLHEAWQSSGQFGKDENIVSQNSQDADMTGKGVSFKSPAICYTYPKVVVAFEADYGDGTSAIYVSSYDVVSESWTSSGYLSDAGVLGFSSRISSSSRRAILPDVTALGTQVVVVWEDTTEPISQIWGNSLFSDNLTEFSGATKITNRATDCKNPSVGFVSSLMKAVILYESQDYTSESGYVTVDTTDGITPNEETSQIFADFYWTTGLFVGSATGYDDELVIIETDKLAHHPHLPKVVSSSYVKLIYDYSVERNDNLKEEEHPIFSIIGDSDIFVESNLVSSWLDTRGVSTVSSMYTKEFAFGDIDDTIGAQMEFRDISMYFGYDARPMSVLKVNTDTVPSWPDNRVYDLYVDSYKNIMAATHSGLAYYNIVDRSVQLIKINPDDSEETNYVVTAIEFVKNGVWFVGTKDFTSYSYDGGQSWLKIEDIKNVRSISSDSSGSAVIGTSTGVYVVPMDFANITQLSNIHKNPIVITNLTASDDSSDDDVKVVKVDEDDIIWAGTSSGIVRIENYVNKTVCDMKNGMRSNYVTDIYIVNRGLRYVSTVSGLEKMRGFTFEHIDVLDLGAVSDNILSINYLSDTNSLWFSAEKNLYELVYRDAAHEKTPNEIVEYTDEIGMEESRDKITNYILGLDLNPNIKINEESTSVLINDNKIDYGYSVDTNMEAIVFETEPLDSDRVSVTVNNKISTFKDFTQTSIEAEVYGTKDTNITKLTKTAQNQLLAMSNDDNNSVLAYAGLSNLPFGLLTIDREKPVACLEAVEQLSRSVYKFKVLASDQISGVTDMVVSNYENFTSDGTTAQSYVPVEQYVVHDIGDSLNETSTEYSFPTSVTIEAVSYSVGTGKELGELTPVGQTKALIFAFTTKPVIVFRFDTSDESWEALAAIEFGNSSTEIHSSLTVGNTLFITTGRDGGIGRIYKTINGSDFTLVGAGGEHVYSSVATDDGSVYFGDDHGTIYEHKMSGSSSSFAARFTNIGEKVLGLEYFNNILYVATENTSKNGSGFQIDLTTGNVLSIFSGPSNKLSDIRKINDDIFIVADDINEIWRSSYLAGEEINFTKSYSTSLQSNIRLYKVPTEVLTDTIEAQPAQ